MPYLEYFILKLSECFIIHIHYQSLIGNINITSYGQLVSVVKLAINIFEEEVKNSAETLSKLDMKEDWSCVKLGMRETTSETSARTLDMSDCLTLLSNIWLWSIIWAICR